MTDAVAEKTRSCLQFVPVTTTRKSNFLVHGSDGDTDSDSRLTTEETDGRPLCPAVMAHHPSVLRRYFATVLDFLTDHLRAYITVAQILEV